MTDSGRSTRAEFAPLVSLTPAQRGRRGPRNSLHDAASEDSVEGTVALLEGGLIDIDEGEPMGWTPLMCAVEKGHLSVARILLSRGADVSVLNDYGFSALLLAIQHGYPVITEMLIKAGADVQTATPQGRAALHLAADFGYLAITEVLIKAGADIESTTPQGCAPLHLAACEGHSEVIRALIEAGANPDSRMPNGETPLFFAAERGCVDGVRELIRGKANPLLTKKREPFCGESNALQAKALQSRGIWLPLHVAVRCGHREVVREIIHQLGFEGCGGNSSAHEALCLAVVQKDVKMMAMLMEAGAVDTGESLIIAAAKGPVASVKLLLQHNKHETIGGNTYVNVRTDFGSMPLVSCIVSGDLGSLRVARLLVDAGADTESVLPVACRTGGTDFLLEGTPQTVTEFLILAKKINGEHATEEQLRTLKAIRRMLMRVAAIHAVSWLWSSDAPFIARATKGSGRAKSASLPLTGMLPILRRRAKRRGVLLSALFRWVVM